MRYTLISLLALLVAIVDFTGAAYAAPAPKTVVVDLPRMNVQGAGLWGVSDSQLVYVLPNPLIHAPGCASCGRPYTDFTNRIFASALHVANGKLIAATAREVFTGPNGYTVSFHSVAGAWVVFEQYMAPESGGPWTMFALNTATGRRIVLDSRDQEGVPSLSPVPRTDGRTVVWQSWTQRRGTVTSVIRSYDLQTGKRSLVAEGGSLSGWSYYQASVSGKWVVFTKRDPAAQHAQVMVASLQTRQVKPITPAGQANSDPWVSGNLVVWRIGWSFSRTNAIAVRNLATGAQRTIPANNTQFPQALLGRYVVYSTGYSQADTRIRLYDDRTHTVRTLAGPHTWSSNWHPGLEVTAGGHALSYQLGKACKDPNFVCPSRVVVTLLP